MFFASKIRATAEAVGVNIAFVRSLDSLIERARTEKPDLVLVDLQNQKVDVIELGKQFKSDVELSGVKLLGFFSHVQTDVQRTAIAAGFDEVIPRSVFARDLAKLLSG
jgi:CheY-like chemotaxis protein